MSTDRPWPPAAWGLLVGDGSVGSPAAASAAPAESGSAPTPAGVPVGRRVVVVTGSSSGIGRSTAAALVGAGAEVVLACRNRAKADEAAATMAGGPGEAVVAEVDLAQLDSVAAFAAWFASRYQRLDVLINNAGVMMTGPTLTPAGVELQWATNHLGHFALTGHLLGVLAATPGSRVVAVSSVAAASGRVRGYDPTSLAGYRRFPSYANSKLANLVFALELDRRLRRAGLPVAALAAHPGVAHTNLTSGWFSGHGPVSRLGREVVLAGSALVSQPPAQGADPTLRAATDPDAAGGRYYGPAGLRQWRGRAVPVTPPRSAADASLGPELWQLSTGLSGVDYLA